MALKHSYALLAPIYDFLVKSALDSIRQTSLKRLIDTKNKSILINGIGTGLDIPYLPEANYTGSDITPAMLSLAKYKSEQHNIPITLICADSQSLPFKDNSFDAIVMHLILAVVPNPELALKEASRVLKPGGKIYLLDKFLRPDQIAPIRRLLNVVLRHVATRTDVVFEHSLQQCTQLKLITDTPALAGGWFRLIELEKYK